MQLGAPPSHVLAIGSGYYCWVSSFVCLALGALSLVAIDAADVRSKLHSLEFSPEFRRWRPGPWMPARRSGPLARPVSGLARLRRRRLAVNLEHAQHVA